MFRPLHLLLVGAALLLATHPSPPPPDSPFKLVGSIGGRLNAVAVTNGNALLAEGDSLRIVDLRDPQHPRSGARLQLPDLVELLRVQGDLALVVTGWNPS